MAATATECVEYFAALELFHEIAPQVSAHGGGIGLRYLPARRTLLQCHRCHSDQHHRKSWNTHAVAMSDALPRKAMVRCKGLLRTS